MKNIKNYLHLYLGCSVINTKFENSIPVKFDARFLSGMGVDETGDDWEMFKPILRPLSDMSEEEAEHFAWLCMDGRHRSKEYAIDKDEVSIELVPNDGGNMLDKNIQVYIGIDCRCWTGYIAITDYGEIKQCEEDSDKREPIDNIAEKVAYLLSRHFDLFGLIESGLAIDKTTLT